MQTRRLFDTADTTPDPWLDHCLKHALGVGLAMVLLFPFARGQLPGLGWAPLWLVGMPLVAWCALHRFRPPIRGTGAGGVHRRRRRMQAQARRRSGGNVMAARRAA